MTALVLALDSEGAVLETAGGKGASLARLARAGIAVPGGFHVTTAGYRRFAEAAKLEGVLAEALQRESAEEAAAQIGAAIAAAPMPSDVAAAVRAACAELARSAAGEGADPGPPAVAVRSSATAEDLPDLSFAGQQETVLGVRGAEGVLAALRTCWASLWGARAIAYRRRNGVADTGGAVALAAVVQLLVDADAAGVAFTRDPVTGAADRISIDAAWGLGESLVGGQVTPDSLAVDRRTGAVAVRTTGDKAVMTVRTDGGTAEVPVPAQKRRAPVLGDAEAAEIARTAVRIEELYGTAMDIEWARAGGALSILQARPVTAAGPSAADGAAAAPPAAAGAAGAEPEVWNDSLLADQLWTSTNVGEAAPGVLTPASWSFLRMWLTRVMPVSDLPGPPMHGSIGGRWYVNYSLTAAFGIGPAQGALDQVYGAIPDGVEVPPSVPSKAQIARAIAATVLPGLPHRLTFLRRTHAHLAAVPELCGAVRGRIAAAPGAAALAEVGDTAVIPLIDEVGMLVWAGMRRGGLGMFSLRPWLERRGVPDADIAALLGSSGSQGGPLASLGPVVGAAQLARGEIGPAAYARNWGHRSPDEFELSAPRPDEDPAWIDRIAEGARSAPVPADTLVEQAHREQQEALARFAARRPADARRLQRRMAGAAVSFRGREAARSEWVRGMGTVRAYLLRAGELSGAGDDVFFLHADETAALLRGDRAVLERVPARRAAHASYSALPVFPRLIRGAFDPHAWAADPHRRTDLFDASAPQAEAAGPPDAEVTGLPGAAGVVEGRVRVALTAAAAEELRTGEVLVAPATNVGWTPLFPRAAAVVTDVGAPLSHAAIVARELRIPAVVGCGDATARLSTGDRVRVDGAAGTVTPLSS